MADRFSGGYQHPEMGTMQGAELFPATQMKRQISFKDKRSVGSARARSSSMPSAAARRTCVIVDCQNQKTLRGYCAAHASEFQPNRETHESKVQFVDTVPRKSVFRPAVPGADVGGQETVVISREEYNELLLAREAYKAMQDDQEAKKSEVTALKHQLVAMKWKTASMASLLDHEEEDKEEAVEEDMAVETPIETVVKDLLAIIHEIRDSDHLQYKILEIVKSLTSPSVYEPLEAGLGLDGDRVSQWIQTEFSNVKKRSNSRRMSQTMRTSPSDYSLWTYDIFSEPQMNFSLCVDNMFATFDLFDKFDISREKFMMFVGEVKGMYRDNPYHNFTHCVDVTQTTFYFLRRTNLIDTMQLTDLDIFALLLAAVCHDMDHPGLNNNFQINQQTPLAIRYNDISVLENHHCCKLFSTLKVPEFCFLDGMSAEDQSHLRSMVITLILNTDMSKHFGLLGKFKARVEAQVFEACDEDRQLLMSLVLHAADISNPAKPFHIAQRWANLVLEEFFRQGDIEKAAGLPVSPMCERESCDKPKQQMDFIDYVVNPLFKALSGVIAGLEEPLHHIENNRTQWKLMMPGRIGTDSPPPSNESRERSTSRKSNS